MGYVYRHGKRIRVEPLTTRGSQRADAKAAWADRFIGCPISWLQRVLPVVWGKHEVVVAIYLHRRRVVCGNRKTIDVPNDELRRIGVTRWGKTRGLQNLAKAGIIAIGRRGQESFKVTFLDPPGGRRCKADKAATKKGGSVAAAAPWALAGMSRATWYRQQRGGSQNGTAKRQYPKKGESLAVTKPWVTEGVSRRAWFRRRAAEKLANWRIGDGEAIHG